LVSWCVKGHLRRLLHRPCCRSSAPVGSRISFLLLLAQRNTIQYYYIQRFTVDLSCGAPRWLAGMDCRVHGYYRFFTAFHFSSACAPLHSSGGWGYPRPPPTQGTTPAAEAAGVRVLLGVRARQTGATIGSILIGSGRTRGAPPRFEVCDVSIIIMSVDSASQTTTAVEKGDGERGKERAGRTVAYPGKVRR